MARELLRAQRSGLALGFRDRVHEEVAYDLAIDSSTTLPHAAAHQVLENWPQIAG